MKCFLMVSSNQEYTNRIWMQSRFLRMPHADSKRTNYQRFGRSGGASGSGRYRSQSTASAGYDPFAYSSGRYQSAAPRRRGAFFTCCTVLDACNQCCRLRCQQG